MWLLSLVLSGLFGAGFLAGIAAIIRARGENRIGEQATLSEAEAAFREDLQETIATLQGRVDVLEERLRDEMHAKEELWRENARMSAIQESYVKENARLVAQHELYLRQSETL